MPIQLAKAQIKHTFETAFSLVLFEKEKQKNTKCKSFQKNLRLQLQAVRRA